MTTRRSEAVLYAEHNQFYVVDPDTSAADDDAGDFDNASFEDRVAVRPGMLTVFTATYGYVRVILERHEERPPDDIGRYDHVVEAPFEAASGRIAALETDVSRTIALDAGERFRYFLDVVRQSGWLSELEDAMSPVTWQDEGGRDSILVRPHPRFAELYAEDEAPGSRPVECELGAWLETVETDYAFVVVFPVSAFDPGSTSRRPTSRLSFDGRTRTLATARRRA